MCGIAGFISHPDPAWQVTINRMNDALHKRGPDDRGVWRDSSGQVVLGHCRLAVLDLSPQGHQPMLSGSRRYVITFNGEVYNYLELRKTLQERGHSFKGTSDTEVLLACFDEWGIEEALKRCVGMLACAVWDCQERVLTLARDRVGEKPLYYGWSGGAFLFSSQLKSLQRHPLFNHQIDRDSLLLFMRHGYVPTPYSIFKGIYKLPPGCLLQIKLSEADAPPPNFAPSAADSRQSLRPRRYWSAKETCEKALSTPFQGSANDALSELDHLLRLIIKGQMIADVPLGAFLSGGVDSSVIAALMQAQSPVPVKTFAIGFYEGEYNEAPYARDVARHLGTDHNELYVTPKEALDVIPKLPELYDEPFADSSQIPTYLVAGIARRLVTVSLSGDGGDELFGGYPRYLWAHRTWRIMKHIPQAARLSGAYMLRLLKAEQWNRLLSRFPMRLPKWPMLHNPGHKIHRLAELLRANTQEALYHKVISYWDEESPVVIGGHARPTAFADPQQWACGLNFIESMMFLDLTNYLPDDIMVKVDRASMGVSLETRAPYLDHRLIEFVWRLPLAMKIRGAETKWILRQLLQRYIPTDLIKRPKMGFAVPVEHWLRGPLKNWTLDLLDPQRLKREGFLNAEPIEEKWREHLSKKRNWAHYLWNILMFESWLKENMKSPP